MGAELAELDYLRALAGRHAAARHGEKGAIIAEACRFLGCDKATLYRMLSERAGYRSGRKARADRGDTAMSDDELRIVATLMVESARANGKRLLPVADALAIALGNRLIDTALSASRVLRLLRERGLHPDQIARPTPYQALRSRHPNHWWQFDVSVCVLFYLDDGGMAVMDEKRFYKNKPHNLQRISRKRVLRYLVTDHYTGAFFFRYYLAAGEDQETLFRFLAEAFAPKGHPQEPFHGVPFGILWDAGSANTSHLIRNLLDRLGVRQQVHTPGNPRAKGQVERTHDLIERRFEGRLYLMRIRDADHLNEAAATFRRWFNGTQRHTRHGHARFALWQTIRPEQLRVAPPRAVLETLLRSRPQAVTVHGDLAVRYTVKGYGANQYSVAHVPGVRVGETLTVCVNPYRAPWIDVVVSDGEGRETLYPCEPLERDGAGFRLDAPVIGEAYRAPPDTDVDGQRKRMAKVAYGADTEREVERARKRREPAFGGGVDPIGYLGEQTTAAYVRRPGSELEIPGTPRVECRPLPPVEALGRISQRLGRHLEPEENRAIRQAHPEGVREEELDQVVHWLRDGMPGRATTSPPAAGGLRAVR
ncbi:hypothetical protein [Endothiovibrio diazotrophicus]